jgi:hypothetical protein
MREASELLDYGLMLLRVRYERFESIEELRGGSPKKIAEQADALLLRPTILGVL